MSLPSGIRLGVYEITGHIGAGGMGEVYRATDTTLGRDVAIKTLLPALASDEERLARFEREAKLLAALNHVNIASVFALNEHHGTRFIAMELVEGESLEERLKFGPVPIEQALELSLQIANALEAAHDKGVVHRDLKPANIMITPDGVVKVLDFGLAKAFSGDPNAATPAHSPALSLAMTQQGLILGTAGYMSPEQASGQAIDQRADIWAFGVVLYEMLTGLPVFSGESVPHILAAVLKTDPDWNRLPKPLHPRIRQLLERCVEKKARDRYHGIADARVDIERVLRDPQGIAAFAPVPAVPKTASLGRLAATAVVGGLLVALGAWRLWPEPMVAPVQRFVHPLPSGQGLTYYRNEAIAISPDGSRFVYNTPAGLFMRSMDDVTARLFRGPESPLSGVTFSPDGRALLYWDVTQAQLMRIPIGGGTPIPVADVPGHPAGVSWGRDGTILYGMPEGILRVSASGGAPQLVIQAREGEQLYGPTLLPDGGTVLFSAASALGTERIVGQSLSSGERTVILDRAGDPRYLPSGHLVYRSGNRLFGVAFDSESLTVSGDPVLLEAGVLGGIGVGSQFEIADDGTLIYAPVGAPTETQLVWVDQQGRESVIGDLAARAYVDARLSPDESRVALEIDDGNGADIWVSELARGTLDRVTSDLTVNRRLIWMPDGDRILFGGNRDGSEGLFITAADGRGGVESLLTFDDITDVRPYAWSSDGTLLLFRYTSPGVAFDTDIGILSIGGDSVPSWRPLVDLPLRQGDPVVSPNGDWFAYDSEETGLDQFEVYVERFPNGGQKRSVSVGGGGYPVWSPEGDALFYRGDGAMMAVRLQTEPTLTLGQPERLFRDEYAGNRVGFTGFTAGSWDVARDGRFLMLKPSQGSPADIPYSQIVIVKNWLAELERRLPTK